MRFAPQFLEGFNFTDLASQTWQYLFCVFNYLRFALLICLDNIISALNCAEKISTCNDQYPGRSSDQQELIPYHLYSVVVGSSSLTGSLTKVLNMPGAIIKGINMDADFSTLFS